MVSHRRKQFNTSFNTFADDYNKVRPGYPAKLFRDLVRECSITKDSSLLEIGAGTGIATVRLAKLGSRIVAIEPGGNLANIARKATAKFSNVTVVEETFENLRLNTKVDAILAFTALHWITDEARDKSVHMMLKPEGYLVAVWNSFFQTEGAVTEAINRQYDRYLFEGRKDAPTVLDVNTDVLTKLNQREAAICSSRTFYIVFMRKYVTNFKFSADTYPKLLSTYPTISNLPDGVRTEFLSSVSRILFQYGTVTVPVLSTLIVARQRQEFIKWMGTIQGARE